MMPTELFSHIGQCLPLLAPGYVVRIRLEPMYMREALDNLHHRHVLIFIAYHLLFVFFWCETIFGYNIRHSFNILIKVKSTVSWIFFTPGDVLNQTVVYQSFSPSIMIFTPVRLCFIVTALLTCTIHDQLNNSTSVFFQRF